MKGLLNLCGALILTVGGAQSFDINVMASELAISDITSTDMPTDTDSEDFNIDIDTVLEDREEVQHQDEVVADETDDLAQAVAGMRLDGEGINDGVVSTFAFVDATNEQITTDEEANDSPANDGETTSEEQAVAEIVHIGSFTFYLRADKTIMYAALAENNRIIKYYEYYDGVTISDEYNQHIKNVYHIAQDGFIRYSEHRTDMNGTIESYTQYVAETTYHSKNEEKVSYVAYMNPNGTIGHVREYIAGHWNKAFKFSAAHKLNHDKLYWEGRLFTFYFKADTEDGVLERATKFNAKGQSEVHYQYVSGTTFAQASNETISYKAFVHPNGTMKHVREYKNGYLNKIFEFPAKTKINHNKTYWEGRKYTYYMKPHRKDGMLDYAAGFTGGHVTMKYFYRANTFYGKGHAKRITKRQKITPPPAPNTKWMMPVRKGLVTCILEKCHNGRYGGRHNGTDIVNNGGAPVYSMANGRVTQSTYIGGLGNIVGVYYRVKNRDYYVIYAHLRSRKVKAGQNVKAGQVVGYVGATGGYWVEHLHIEVLRDVKSFIKTPNARRKKAIGLNAILPVRLGQRLK